MRSLDSRHFFIFIVDDANQTAKPSITITAQTSNAEHHLVRSSEQERAAETKGTIDSLCILASAVVVNFVRTHRSRS